MSDYQSARLAKRPSKDSPYRKGRVVTTDPEAPGIRQAKAKQAVYVDPLRMKAWEDAGFFAQGKAEEEA